MHMVIHKNQSYIGMLNGREVHVMPVAVAGDSVTFSIGCSFGNRVIFDGARQDSMQRGDFENTFSLIQGEEE